MIEEVGTVVELRGKHLAMVLCQKSSLCDHCATSGACHIKDDGRARLVEAHNALGATVGDRVRVAVSTRTFLQSSFIVYIVPLLALVIGAVIGKLVGETLVDGPSPDLLSAIFGVFFLAGSFLVIRLGSRVLSPEAFRPQITAILHDDEA
jgi:sigma-E factor negative regulatory protein RseC